jgi:transcriptional regulator with XRE-family HTH domain
MRRARYSDEAVTERIEKARKKLGITNKEVAERVGIPLDRWSRKMRGAGNSFTLAEIAAVADALESPAGWPFVDWDYAQAMARGDRE